MQKLAAQPLSSKCFEIESILVDACDLPEGENEMVYLRIGPNPINTNDFEIKWPNAGNPWLNFCQNSTTAQKVQQINQTITCPTGKLIEPTNGVLPAGARVLIITSVNYKVGSHDFSNLCDEVYVVFQCPGNTNGHFANYNANNPSNPRNLEIRQKSTNCEDEVSYVPNDLSKLGDGDAAFFEPNGTVSYKNIGCKIPLVPICEIAIDSVNLRTYCTGQSVKVFFTGRKIPQYNYTWKATDKPDFPFVTPYFVIWNTPGPKTVTLHIDKTPYSNTPETCTATINIAPMPEANFTLGALTACVDQGISVTPQVSGNPPNTQYIWQLGGGIATPSNPSTAPFTISWNTTGTKTIRFRAFTSAPQCTSAFVSQVVTISPRPTATFSIFEKTTCAGETLRVRANEAGVANATYKWYLQRDGQAVALPPSWQGQGLHSVVLTQPGTYQLYFEAEADCKSTSITQTWQVDPIPSFNLQFSGNSQPICAGANLVITVNTLSPSNAQLFWNNTDGVVPQQQSPGVYVVSWSTPGVKTIRLRAFTSRCTSAFTTQTVEVLALPTASLAIQQLPQCSGGNLQLSANDAGVAGSTYKWEVKREGQILNISTTWSGRGAHNLQSLSPGNYEASLEVTTPGGCQAKVGPINWKVDPVPSLSLQFPMTPPVACTGQPLTMTVAGLSPPQAQLVWQASDGVSPTSIGNNVFQISWSTPGTKTLRLVATVGNCSSTVITANIEVTPTPIAEIIEQVATPKCTGDWLNLRAVLSGTLSTYHWQLKREGVSISLPNDWKGPGPYTKVLEEAGTYELTLVVTSPSNCSSNVITKTWVVNQMPSFQLTPEAGTTCGGKNFQFQVLNLMPPTAQRVWNISEGATPQPIDNNTFQITWNTPGIRTISLLAIQNGCSLERRSIVTVYAYPNNQFSIGGEQQICQHEIRNVNYPGTYQSGWQFQWQVTLPNGQAQNWTNSPGPHRLPTQLAGVVTVSLVVDNNGCSLPQYTQTVLIKPRPQVTIDAPERVCTQQVVEVKSQSDITLQAYLWEVSDFSTGAFPVSQNPISLSWQTIGTKTVRLRGVANGCTSEYATRVVTVLQTPNATLSTVSESFCQNRLQLVSHVGIAGPNANFLWKLERLEPLPVEEIAQSTHRGPYSIQNLTAGKYRLNLNITDNNCTAEPKHVVFTIYPIPEFDFQVSKSDFCQAQQVTLTIPSQLQNPTHAYIWNITPSSGLVPSNIIGAGPHVLQGVNVGNFTISAYAISSYGCTSRVVERGVTVHPVPKAQIIASRAILCINDSITLRNIISFPNFSYSWKLNSGESINHTTAGPFWIGWSTPGVRTVELIVSSAYCADTHSLAIQVVLPPPPPPSLELSRCGSGSVTFTITGTDLQSLRLFTYNNNQPYQIVNQAPYVFTAPSLASSNLSITTTFWLENYNIQAQCGSSRSPVRVTILPVPSASNFSVARQYCQGDTVLLAANSNFQAGHRFLWQGPNGFLLDTTSSSYKWVAHSAGNYTYSLRIINSFNCTSEARSQVVRVNPLPTTPVVTYYHIFKQEVPLCQGNEINLSVLNYPSYPDGARFIWEGPAGFYHEPHPFPGVPRAELHHTGYYTVRVVAQGCTSQVGRVWVQVYPKPLTPQITSNSPLCLGAQNPSNLELFVLNPVDSMRYYWIGPDAWHAQGAQHVRVVTPNVGGKYRVVAISPQGCYSDTAFTQVELLKAPHDLSLLVRGSRCQGSSFMLEATPISGATYIWKTPAGETFITSSSTLLRSDITQADAGVYSVSYIIGNCTSSVASISVTVLPQPQRPSVIGTTTLCQDQDLKLEIFAPESNTEYIWEIGSTTHSGNSLVLPYSVASNLHSIKVYGTARGCTSVTQTINLQWVPKPQPPSIYGRTTYCLGDTIELAILNPIHNWQYVWAGPQNFSVTSTTMQRIASAATLGGGYSVVATYNGCTSLPALVSVNVRRLPEPVVPMANATVICAGQTLVLSIPAPHPRAVRWQGPNGFASTLAIVNLPNVTPEHSGLYYVSSFDGYCYSAKRSIAVVVHPLPDPPTLFSNVPICTGQTLRLTAITNPWDAEVIWEYGSNLIGAGREFLIPNVTLQNKGEYQAYAISKGCTSQFARTWIEIFELPLTPTIIGESHRRYCEGTSFSLAVRQEVGVNYYWQGPSGAVSTKHFIELTNVSSLQAGNYSVVAIQNGCTSKPTNFVVDVVAAPASPLIADIPRTCLGSMINLCVQGRIAQVQYLWRGPAGFEASGACVSVLPRNLNQRGMYSVVAMAGGCTSTAAVVNVLPDLPPELISVQSNSPLCQGETLNLVVDAREATSYVWYGPNGFRSTQRMPVIPNVVSSNAGVYEVVAINGACTSQAQAVNVVIKQLPTASQVRSNSPICSGEAILLTASSRESRVAFYWTGPNGFQSTQSAPRIFDATTTSSGQYTAVAILEGCTSEAANVSVVVNPKPPVPEISSNSPICVGQALRLTAPTIPIAGLHYQWSGPNNFNSTLQNPIIANTSTLHTGVYRLQVWTNSCTTLSPPLQVVVRPAPDKPKISSSSNSPCAGTTLHLTPSTASLPGIQYFWSGPAGFTSSNVTPLIPNITTQNSGIYSLVIIQNGCTSQEATFLVEVRTCDRKAGPEAEVITSVFFYPNPAREQVWVEWNDNNGIGTYPIKYTFWDNCGSVVKKGILSKEGTISLGDLPEGIYQVVLETATQVQKLRLVRMK
ncbi:MAG: T9SS type A sorting domain-containing protein [Bacteroidia bacterium]|nr:T9SS type A sorting domain-containing protein [Bacteroidia bacterium]